MNNIEMIKKPVEKPIVFIPQIPITDIDANKFRQAIKGKKIKCSINGARVNQNSINASIDVSFKILDNLKVINPGTSITGKTLDVDGYKQKSDDAINKNVTLSFEVNNTDDSKYIEITNNHGIYSIISTVLKSNGVMDADEQGGIIVFYPQLNKLITGGIVTLTSRTVKENDGWIKSEVSAIWDGETQ